tara:strand:- start:323 stop:520 length:198 start_codon:yes stop_codon:yes gene_type:complete
MDLNYEINLVNKKVNLELAVEATIDHLKTLEADLDNGIIRAKASGQVAGIKSFLQMELLNSREEL